MLPETYRQRIADSRHPQGVRQRLVQHWLEHRSISFTARAFGCDRKTVRTWVRRYHQGGWAALVDRRRSGHAPLHKTPASIEREVLRLVAQGRSNSEIARALVISDKTVKTHVSNILSKLDLEDRTQLAIYAIKNGLVE